MKVVDSNVIIHGTGMDEDLVTIQEVIDELKSRKASRGLESHQIDVQGYSQDSLNKVKEKSEEINSRTSNTDEKLLALALDLECPLITDDKELQNLGLHLEVDIEGFLDSIPDEKLSWEMKCSQCGRSPSECQCGSNPERKLSQRSPV